MPTNNVFDVDDDPKDDVVKAPKPEEKEPAIVPDPETGEIELSTEADPDEGLEPTERQQRRRERGHLRKEAEEQRAENERLRIENVRLESARAAAETVARLTQQRAEPQVSRLDQEIARIEKQKRHLYEAYNAKAETITPEDLAQYRKDAAELNDLHDELKHQKFNARSGIGRQEDPETAAVRAGLNMMYPDVMGNNEYKAYALATYNQRRVGKPAGGEQDDVAEAMRLTRQKYNLKGSRPAPTPQTRQMYTGSSAGSAGKVRPGNGKLVLTKEMAKDAQKMADELYSKQEKDAGKRLQMWARRVGPTYLANQAKKNARA